MCKASFTRAGPSTVRGFALIEVLIAVTIIGIAIPALMLRMQSIVNTNSYIEERTVAYWIAENKMQELLAEQQLTRSVARAQKEKGEIEYADRQWYWSSVIEQVPLPKELDPHKMFRIDIEVGLDEDGKLASLSGFIDE